MSATTLANSIPKAWEEFDHMEEYDSPSVTKDDYAKFILHVHEKSSLTEQVYHQQAKLTFLCFTRTSPEFFDGWDYPTGTIRSSKFAIFWVACCKAFESKYSIRFPEKLPVKPISKPKIVFANDFQVYTPAPTSTGFFLSTKTAKSTVLYDPMTLLNISPTKYDTFITINVPEATETKEAQSKIAI